MIDYGEIEIKTFTASELSQWLDSGQPVAVLDAGIISRTRARALVHNPYVKPEDPLLAAVLTGGKEAIAFTAAFPELIGGVRYWWFSTLWCHPDHRGKGFPLVLMRTLGEEYGTEHCLDTMGAPETVAIFNNFGHRLTYLQEFRFGTRVYPQGTLGRVVTFREGAKNLLRNMNPRLKGIIRQSRYELLYQDLIDQDTYGFIAKHAAGDIIPRTREMLNWILQYPFKHCTPLRGRTSDANPFGDCDTRYWIKGVKVNVGGQMVGHYIIRNAEQDLSIKYLYYDRDYKEEVFNSILQHILRLGNPCFTTRDPLLSDYLLRNKVFSKQRTDQISFSYPQQFQLPTDPVSQGGDGDCFV